MPKNVEVAEEVVRTGRIEKNRKAYPQIIHKVNGRKATCMRAADIGNTSKLNSQSLLFLPLLIGQEIYDKLSLQNPAYKQISVSSGTASVAFDRLGNQRAADRYSFNTENGEFTETSLYQHQDKAGKIRGWIYSVHVGNWGGMTTRILTFLAALVGASLPLTGYYLWIKKMINKRKREKTIALSAAGKRDIA